MKKRQLFTILISLIIGISIGIMAGITLTNPGVSMWEAAGSIGRLDQYRHVRITQEDIQLRNELLEDDQRRQAFTEYLAFEYACNVQLGEHVRFAIQSVEAARDFHSAHFQVIDHLDNLNIFLDNARLRILEAMHAMQELDRDRVAIQSRLKDAGNALVHSNQRSSILFDYLDRVQGFFDSADPKAYPDLYQSYGRIFNHLVAVNTLKGNRPGIEHLLAKRPMEEISMLQLFDSQTLENATVFDAEKLGVTLRAEISQEMLHNAEQLEFLVLDSEQHRFIFYSREQLEAIRITDAEQLGFYDAEQLGFYDAEQLGVVWDAEQLGYVLDAQILRAKMDAEQLAFYDLEQLGWFQFFDAENLGFHILDTELLGILIWP